jgi:hypothetical protein
MNVPHVQQVAMAVCLSAICFAELCNSQTQRVSYVSQVRPVSFKIPGEKWNELFTKRRFIFQHGDDLILKVGRSVDLKLLTQNVDEILSSDFKLTVLDDYEFNFESEPKVLVGIRCVPTQRRGRSVFYGVLKQYYEVSQLMVLFLDSDTADSIPVRIETRSGEHDGNDGSLTELGQSVAAAKLASDVRARILERLQNADFSVR